MTTIVITAAIVWVAERITFGILDPINPNNFGSFEPKLSLHANSVPKTEQSS